jgi:YD repeat-containing protein
VFRHDESSSEFYGARIAWNGWTLDFRDVAQFLFPEAYNAKTHAPGAPFEMKDAAGRRIRLKRDERRNLEQLISSSGRTIRFKYDGSDRIVEAADDNGNIRKYSYGSSGHLESVADASLVLYRFEYAALLHFAGYDPYVMTAIVDGGGRVLLQNSYDDGGRISKQRLANGDTYNEYGKNEIVETIVSAPVGIRKSFSSMACL